MSSEPESFLARWSRRKRTVERETERPADAPAPVLPAATQAGAGGAGDAAAVPASVPVREPTASEIPLPPIESLDGLRSDYQAFFQQPVDEGLRRAALSKLFADPHFNKMDMLDVYVDDYTQFEPLPAAMRLRLPSARAFLLDSERAELEASEAAGDAPQDAAVAATDAATDRADTAAAPAHDSVPASGDPRGAQADARTQGPAYSPADGPARIALAARTPDVLPGQPAATDSSST